jgi:antitoxin component of MazEF toxin-antitoxin module
MMTVVVKKIGGSVGIVIPQAVAREMGLIDGTSLDITTNSDTIVMRRRGRRSRRALSSIVDQIKTASYQRRRRELSNDAPIGKEIW